MHKTTVYLPDELKVALARAARERGRSEADLIREAIAALTRGPDAPAPRLPLFRASGPPIAEDVDTALAEGFGRE
ncbi:MAG: CopG family transcriptional regulator [Myxococcota bacterium]